jgi:uncharacterized membrane protein (UPF0127 family)
MLFINKEGEVVHIQHSTTPESLDLISPKYPTQKVLEIRGGLSKQLGLEVGNLLL